MACQGLSRVFLVIINIFFVVSGLQYILGLVIFAAGIAIKFGSKYLDSYIKSMKDNINGLTSGANIVPGTNPTTDPSEALNLDSIFGIVGIIFIVLGLFLFCLGSSGCCGACCKLKPLLVFYCIFSLVILILFIAVLVLFANKKVDNTINTELETIVKTSYTGVDDTQPTSLFLSYIMVKYKCCGVNGYKDFDLAIKWKRTREMTIQSKSVILTMMVGLTPVACCKMSGDFPSFTPVDSNCTLTSNNLNNNMNSGCDKEITKLLDPYRPHIIGVCGGISGFQLLCFILGVYLIIAMNKDNKIG